MHLDCHLTYQTKYLLENIFFQMNMPPYFHMYGIDY